MQLTEEQKSEGLCIVEFGDVAQGAVKLKF